MASETNWENMGNESHEVENLEKLLACDTLPLDIVYAFAGDRVLTSAESRYLDEIKERRNGQLYSDLLYAISHQFFSNEFAETLWNNILEHKYNMSLLLKRNVKITVASLDYLTNLTSALQSATVMSEEQVAEIVRMSLHDSLTGLFNHAYCFQKLDMELTRYVRYGDMVSVMMIDIDDFKEMNDLMGHQEGDRILTMIGKIIKKTARDSDVCCRYGGEEFALILPMTDSKEASILSERMKDNLAQNLPFGKRLTVSIGVASSGMNVSTSQALIKKADAALYQAKKNGKNQVYICP